MGRQPGPILVVSPGSVPRQESNLRLAADAAEPIPAAPRRHSGAGTSSRPAHRSWKRPLARSGAALLGGVVGPRRAGAVAGRRRTRASARATQVRVGGRLPAAAARSHGDQRDREAHAQLEQNDEWKDTRSTSTVVRRYSSVTAAIEPCATTAGTPRATGAPPRPSPTISPPSAAESAAGTAARRHPVISPGHARP